MIAELFNLAADLLRRALTGGQLDLADTCRLQALLLVPVCLITLPLLVAGVARSFQRLSKEL